MKRKVSKIPLQLAYALCVAKAFSQTAAVQCPAPSDGEAKPWLNASYTPECRAQFVVQQLKTLDDKFAFLMSSGQQRPGAKDRNVMAELGLKTGGGSDGPAGATRAPGATALPTPLAVGASFDPAIAAKYGDLLGQEFFAAGLNSVLGPAMDIPRTWHFGRTTESFGEDPFLDAAIVAPEIRAIQANHVIATAKHFAVYNQEQGRAGEQPTGLKPSVNEAVSERAIREIYLPGFRAAVVEGKAGAIMCSFPRINGVYACENPYTLGILKKEWRFDGVVGPDYPDGQRTIIPAFLAGLDSGAYVTGSGPASIPAASGQRSLRIGVESGEVPVNRIDDMIFRRLVAGFRIGVFDYPAVRVAGEVSTPERRAAAVDIATSGAVLLRNERNILPFGAGIKSVAVIGTQATDKAFVVEQGSPHVAPAHLVPVLEAVRERAGKSVAVTFAAGTLGLLPLPDVPTSMMRTPDGEPGVRAEYFANPQRDFSGKPFAARVEPILAIEKAPDLEGLPKDFQWSVRYTTMFTPSQTGVQHFTLCGSSEGRLFIDGKLMGEYMRDDFQDTVFANVAMIVGKPVELRVEFSPREAITVQKRAVFGIALGPYFNLGWSGPHDLIQQAAEAARHADIAVVTVGHQIGEGMDRLSLSLPNDQNELIEAVAKANPRTVVILNTGGPITMPWLDRVAGVIEMWLPGDAAGTATARLLFGDADPGGRLPVTFPASEAQGPGTQPDEYPGTLDAVGTLDTAHFTEGIFVGYRYWDQHEQKPLFPFGYGLSYSTFDIHAMGVTALPDGSATIEAVVKNTGLRAGSEVVQAYLAFPKAAGEPPKQLKAFAKVLLQPGEQKLLHLTLNADAFQYWDEARHRWTTPAGSYKVMLGRSSRDIVWTGSVVPAKR